MVPDKFNMVDMDGIDLIMMQGEEVPGLYNRLVESIAQCRYQCLYNWFFDGVVIPPSYVEMEVNEDDEVAINEGVTVSSDDVIHIYSIEPPAPEPEIIPLLVEENGVYNVPTGKDGFNPVTVDVPSYTPVIQSKTISENGTYYAPEGVDGFDPVTVDVPSYTPVIQSKTITGNGTYYVPEGVDGFNPVIVNVSSSDVVGILTNSMGSSSASIDIIENNAFVETVVYTTVQSGNYKDFDFIRIMYSPPASSSPDGTSHSGWCAFALDDCSYNGATFTANQLVLNWLYNQRMVAFILESA